MKSKAKLQIKKLHNFNYFTYKLHAAADLVFTSAKEVMFLPDFVCLSVYLCVSKITQKVMDGSFWNFEGISGVAGHNVDSQNVDNYNVEVIMLKSQNVDPQNVDSQNVKSDIFIVDILTVHHVGYGISYKWFNFGRDLGGIRELLAKQICWRHLANDIALAEVPASYDCFLV